MKSIILTIFLIASAYSYGQQLVYTPINPAFGGSEFNYAWMLSSAESQNKFEDDQDFGLDGLNLDFLNDGTCVVNVHDKSVNPKKDNKLKNQGVVYKLDKSKKVITFQLIKLELVSG